MCASLKLKQWLFFNFKGLILCCEYSAENEIAHFTDFVNTFPENDM